MESVIKTLNLTKRYGQKLAVNNVSMNVQKGDIYGFIGRNGAGKTTAMKMFLGLTIPTAGSIELFGSKELNRQRSRIGSLIESPGLYKNLSAYENMKSFALLTDSSNSEIKELLTLVGLANTGRKKAEKFSLGMRQRLGIAIAMLGNPQLLVLDEPNNGLDPAGIKEVRDVILKLNRERGVTFIISSHILDELARITTRYGIINNGVLVEEVTAQELHERCRSYISIKVNEPQAACGVLEPLVKKPGIAVNGNEIILNDVEADTSLLVEGLVKNNIKVYEIVTKQTDFESYFIKRLGGGQA